MALNPYLFSGDQPVRWVAGRPKSRTIIVLTKSDIIVATKLKEPTYQEFEQGWKRGEAPEELLPAGFAKIPLERLTRLQHKDSPRISYSKVTLHYVENDEAKSIVLPMGDAGMRDNFVHNLNVRTKWKRFEENASPLGLCALCIGLGMLGPLFLGLIYWGVVSGEIREIHVILAFFINMFGPISLLVIGGLIQLIGIVFAIVQLLSPPKLVTYEPEYEDLERYEDS